MKKLMLWVEVALGSPLPRRRAPYAQERLPAGVLVAGVLAVADDVALLRAGAAERVVPAAGVVDDRGQHVAVRGQQPRAGRQVDRALLADRVDRAVAVGVVVRVVEQRVDGLVAVQVDDPHARRPGARRSSRRPADLDIEQGARPAPPTRSIGAASAPACGQLQRPRRLRRGSVHDGSLAGSTGAATTDTWTPAGRHRGRVERMRRGGQHDAARPARRAGVTQSPARGVIRPRRPACRARRRRARPC